MKYKVEYTDSCAYMVYVRRKFMFIPYWSLMCRTVTFESASTLINNLRLINEV